MVQFIWLKWYYNLFSLKWELNLMLQNSKKDKSIPVQAWIGPEASRRLRLPTHRPPLSQRKIFLVLVSAID